MERDDHDTVGMCNTHTQPPLPLGGWDIYSSTQTPSPPHTQPQTERHTHQIHAKGVSVKHKVGRQGTGSELYVGISLTFVNMKWGGANIEPLNLKHKNA